VSTQVLNIFSFDSDGKVYTAWLGLDGQGWHDWEQLGVKTFNQPSFISAVSKYPGDIDLFAFDSDGKVYTMSRSSWPTEGWNIPAGSTVPDWIEINLGSKRFFQQYFITAVSREQQEPDLHPPLSHLPEMDIFALDSDGKVFTAWWNSYDGWHPWKQIGAKEFGQQFIITAVSRKKGGGLPHADIDLFVFESDGKGKGILYTSRLVDGNYTAWEQIGSKVFNVPYSPLVDTIFAEQHFIAAVSKDFDQIDLFAVDSDGGIMRVYTTWWDNESRREWEQLGTKKFERPSVISAVFKPLSPFVYWGDLHVYVHDSDGKVYTMTWSTTDGWFIPAGSNVPDWVEFADSPFSRSPFMSTLSVRWANEIDIFAFDPKLRTSYVEIDKMRGLEFPPNNVQFEDKNYTLESIYEEAGIDLTIIYDDENIPNLGGPHAVYNNAELDSLVKTYKNPYWPQDTKRDMAAYLVVVTTHDQGWLGLMWRITTGKPWRDACAVFYNQPLNPPSPTPTLGNDKRAFLRTSAHELGHEFNLHACRWNTHKYT